MKYEHILLGYSSDLAGFKRIQCRASASLGQSSDQVSLFSYAIARFVIGLNYVEILPFCAVTGVYTQPPNQELYPPSANIGYLRLNLSPYFLSTPNSLVQSSGPQTTPCPQIPFPPVTSKS
jgi:hypothetical protein